MNRALVLVLSSGGADADETLRAAREQVCPVPFVVAALDAGAAPGQDLDDAIAESDADVIALLQAGSPPADGWLAALVAALDRDADAGAAAGSLGRGRLEPARHSIDHGEGAFRRFAAQLDRACSMPVASCAFRRAAWDEVRFDPRAPLGELGSRLARALLEAGWAKLDVPEARVQWSGPDPAGPRWEPVIFLSPAQAALAKAADLAWSGARAAVRKLRERGQNTRAWHEQVPWSLLGEQRPARKPPRAGAAQGSLTVNWVVPAFYAGSGGHMTIFRLVRHLEELGHACRVIVTHTEGLLPAEGARIRSLVHQHFQPIRARCLPWRGRPLPDADVHVATHWDTAFVVDRRRERGAGAYLVQDWEPSFHPVGTRASVAEQTYSLGLQHVTAGPWLAGRLRARGQPAVHFDLAVDPVDYFVESGAAPPPAGRIAVYLRPLTERRGFEVLALALAEVKRRRPSVEIAAYGAAPGELPLPFEATKMGVLPTAALRKLYCTSTLGLSCSLSNHSLVPQEMWACGLPVVEVDAESTRAVYRDGQDVALAPFDPRAMADRILAVLDDGALRAHLRENGLQRAARLDWRTSARQVEAGLRLAVERAMRGEEA